MRPRPWRRRTELLQYLLIILCLPLPLIAQQKSEMTLAEFQAAVRERVVKPAPSSKRGEKSSVENQSEKPTDNSVEVFSRLLTAQARKAAARQSQDRLAGWRKSAESRLAVQNTTLLDAEQLRLAEAQASAQVARYEAARLRALENVNAMLGRSASTPLTAEMAHLTGSSADEQAKKSESSGVASAAAAAPGPAAAAPAAVAEPAPDLNSRISYYEKHLLPMGAELLSKTYQSYQFGGIALSSLLWQERELTRMETDYRLLHVQAEIEFTKGSGARRE